MVSRSPSLAPVNTQSIQTSLSREGSPSPPDPLGHLSSFIKSLQQKSKHDSDTIVTLKDELDRLKQGQTALQAEVDAIKVEQVALGKVVSSSVPHSGVDHTAVGPSNGADHTRGSGGRKRARSVTGTLEQDDDASNEVATVEITSATLLAKLDALKANLLNEVRQSGADLAGLELGCGCGYVAQEAADNIAVKIDNLESVIKKLVEAKAVEIEGAMGDQLDGVEGRMADVIEDFSGGCCCGGADTTVVEDKVDGLRKEMKKELDGVNAKVDQMVESLKAHFHTFTNTPATSSTSNAVAQARSGRPLVAAMPLQRPIPAPARPLVPPKGFNSPPPLLEAHPPANSSESESVSTMALKLKLQDAPSKRERMPSFKKAKKMVGKPIKTADDLGQLLFPSEPEGERANSLEL